jgi:hypothetical protein
MKFLVLLFSLYMLALPAIAQQVDVCQDTEVCTADDACEDDGCSEEEADDCGSFCACSCCVHIVSVNNYSPVCTVVKAEEKNILLSFYHNISLPSNYFGNIWQPPRAA